MRRIVVACLLVAPAAFAMAANLGEVALNWTEILEFFITMIGWACIFVGAGFLLASVKQYKDHRDNPQRVSLAKVLTYFILGFCLVVLPLLVKYIQETDTTGYHDTESERVKINY